MTLSEQLARCDAEIAAMELQRDAPAWLVTLGVTDWQMEKSFILAQMLAQNAGGVSAHAMRQEGL